MNFNNRLSSTLANNIKLDSNVEHEAEKIAGGNIIWLVNRPAGVKIYVNSTPDRTGALVLNEANRGYKWEQLGEYGSLKLYDNFYIWTEGTNLNNDKIELQVSPNADIITPILGNTADKIDKISELEHIGDNVIFALYESQKNLIDTSKTKFLKYINGSFDESTAQGNNTTMIYVSKLADFTDVKFSPDECYRILIQGHADIGGELENWQSGGGSGSWSYSAARDSLHLDLIDLADIDFDNNFNALATKDLIENIFKSKASNFTLEKKSNFFCFWGMKFGREWGVAQSENTGVHSFEVYTPCDINFKIENYAFGFLFQKMKHLILSLKSARYYNHYCATRGFHFSLKIQIDKMERLPNSPAILTNPYINNDI